MQSKVLKLFQQKKRLNGTLSQNPERYSRGNMYGAYEQLGNTEKHANKALSVISGLRSPTNMLKCPTDHKQCQRCDTKS